MDQTREDALENNGPPAKRRRLSHTEVDDAIVLPQQSSPPNSNLAVPTTNGGASVDEDQITKEVRAGITVYVNPNAPGFTGVLKQRYTDFLVNEVLPDGRVLHLESLVAPKRYRDELETTAQPNLQSQTNEHAQPETKKDDQKVAEEVSNIEPQMTISPDDGVAVEIPLEDRATLISIFGEETTNSMLPLYNARLKHPHRKSKDFKAVTSEIIPDKSNRTRAHQTVRKIFSSLLETETQDDERIVIKASAPNQGRGGRGGRGNRGGSRGGGSGDSPRVKNKLGWDELGGEYLHFTLYKENKDTMESVYYLASQLKAGVKGFQFGGTKDRRGVTVQRVSAYRVHAEQLAAVGRRMYGGKVGDFEYRPDGLELGELGGNEFVITLRDCHFPGEEGLDLHQRTDLARRLVTESMESFRIGGFINYYGLQRFGAFAASTDAVGTKLLQGDLKGAIDDILAYTPAALAAAQAAETREKTSGDAEDTIHDHSKPLISSDDCARALAIHTWQTTQDSSAALFILPRKFAAENSIIRHLGFRDRRDKNALSSLNDYQGALQGIPRNLRLMYVHAYQSLVWNVVAGLRWERFGNRVVEGDLVLVKDMEKKKKKDQASEEQMVDEAGEPIVVPSGANSSLSTAGASFERAHPLSAAEAASGDYDIFDVVLPLPGYDVVYPPNIIGEFYKEFMSSERGGRLDPMNMRRSWKDLSLSGGFRKLLGRCPSEALKAEVRVYRGDEQLVETDAERLEKNSNGKKNGSSEILDKRHGVPENGRTSQTVVEGEEKIAVVLQLRLAPSQYATMALRELMKEGGVKTYKAEYGNGR